MRICLGLAFAFCLTSHAGEITQNRSDSAQEDLQKLAGTWKMESLEIEGKQIERDRFSATKLTVRGDKYIVKTAKSEYQVTLRLDPSGKPKEIDMDFANGKEPSKVSKGIYDLDGDQFRLCRAQAAGAARPTEFATKPDSGLFLVVWKREKAAVR
jgi:uncharacterized protein (TIGR03067 family)